MSGYRVATKKGSKGFTSVLFKETISAGTGECRREKVNSSPVERGFLSDVHSERASKALSETYFNPALAKERLTLTQ